MKFFALSYIFESLPFKLFTCDLVLLLYDYRIVDNILLLLLIRGHGHRLRNKCDVYVKVFCEDFLLFIFLTVSTYDC